MKSLLSIFLIAILSLLLIVIYDQQEVSFESWESKSTQGDSVYNKIKWFQFQDQDVWMMNQSHHGPMAAAGEWDRVAIVIDKTKSPKQARFYQFEPGPLVWSENIQVKPYRVSCFMCHSNGPRVIRPQPESVTAPLSFYDKLKISYWNFRIKNYGRVVESPDHKILDQDQMPPFRYQSQYENEQLKVKACLKCHNDLSQSSLGPLTRQQLPTIRFMLANGLMPPKAERISKKEKNQLEHFLMGF